MDRNPLKIDRKRHPELMSILLLLLTITVIVFVLSQVQSYLPKSQQEVPRLKQGKVGVADSLYLNFYHYFSWKKPSSRWQFRMLKTDSVRAIVNKNLPLFPQIQWLVALSTDSAYSQIGLLQWRTGWSAKNAVVQLLAESMEMYEHGDKLSRIIVPLNSPAHRVLQGAFTVVLFPESGEDKFPLWIISVLPRNDVGYVIISKTTETFYPATKNDLEQLVTNFTAISRTLFD